MKVSTNEIKAGRVWCGLSQKDVADALGMKVATYRAKENGVNQFTDEEKVALAKILGWDMELINSYLYGGIFPI